MKPGFLEMRLKFIRRPIFGPNEPSLTGAMARDRLIARGISVNEWAREHGFSRHAVRDVLRGRCKGLRGEGHLIRVALGMKAPPVAAIVPRSSGALRVSIAAANDASMQPPPFGGIGSRISIERGRLNLSQKAFADLAQISKRALINWEQEQAHPNARVLELWSRAGIDVLYIITGRRESGCIDR